MNGARHHLLARGRVASSQQHCILSAGQGGQGSRQHRFGFSVRRGEGVDGSRQGSWMKRRLGWVVSTAQGKTNVYTTTLAALVLRISDGGWRGVGPRRHIAAKGRLLREAWKAVSSVEQRQSHDAANPPSLFVHVPRLPVRVSLEAAQQQSQGAATAQHSAP